MPPDQPYSLMTANLVRPVRVLHICAEGSSSRADVAATEEPLEVRIDGEPFAVIMRTPGTDQALVAGFLFAERVILSPCDILSIERDANSRNMMDVRIGEARARALSARAEARRRVVMNSSCGLCGRVTIESLRVGAVPLLGQPGARRTHSAIEPLAGLPGRGLARGGEDIDLALGCASPGEAHQHRANRRVHRHVAYLPVLAAEDGQDTGREIALAPPKTHLFRPAESRVDGDERHLSVAPLAQRLEEV